MKIGRGNLKKILADAKAGQAKRRNKFNARKVEYDGWTFDSAVECERYKELKLLEACGQISSLIVHPVFMLTINGITIGRFTPDFRYIPIVPVGGVPIIEDVKSKPTKTAAYSLRVRVFKACYPEVEFKEVFGAYGASRHLTRRKHSIK